MPRFDEGLWKEWKKGRKIERRTTELLDSMVLYRHQGMLRPKP